MEGIGCFVRIGSKELKMLYRKLVKILHSDMNPERTDAQRELFSMQ